MKDIDRNINSILYNKINSLSLENSVARPFFSYYGQSPIEDSNGEIYYGHNFTITEKSNIIVSRNSPVLPSFKMKSVIRIYRKV